jgi:RNA polymerase sigma factor (sigma-70 family)
MPHEAIQGQITMEEAELSELATQWSVVLRAGQEAGDEAAAARNKLLLRYHEAVLRYLRAELRDEHAAGQVYSNFAVRVLEVDRFLQRADPQRGRFRDYLRTVLRHMVADHFRAQQRENKQREEFVRHREGQDESNEPASEEEKRFLSCWRQELINWAWQRLEQTEQRTGQPYSTLLRLQEQQPGLRSAQIAERLATQLERPFTAEGIRQLAHRGRELFGEMLVREAARSLQVDLSDSEGVDRVEEELIDLELLFSFCKAVLDRFRQR